MDFQYYICRDQLALLPNIKQLDAVFDNNLLFENKVDLIVNNVLHKI